MTYYSIMLEYLKTNQSYQINLINRGKYLVNCVILLDGPNESSIFTEVYYKNNRKFTIIFDRNQFKEEKEILKSVFEIIENQSFCNNKFCNLIINKENEMVGNVCFRCAFYKDYKKTIDLECSICLENNDINSIHLNCDHIFHKECLYKSCNDTCISHIETKCPLCRKYLHFNNSMEQIDSDIIDDI
jgi:hypothetical protein